jgi:hypothetical protein
MSDAARASFLFYKDLIPVHITDDSMEFDFYNEIRIDLSFS